MAKHCGALRLGRFLALGLALSLMTLMFSSVIAPAGAQDDAVAVIELEQLRTSGGADMVPVRVLVESRRAVDGVLEVSARESNLTWQFPIAVAANTEVQQLIGVPTGSFDGIGRLDATLFSGNDELAEARLDDREANANAIGLLGVESPGEEVNLNPDIGLASVVELNDLRLLPALDSVVVSPAGFRSLTPEEQDLLVSWIWSGHQLLVADDPGSLDGLLPNVATSAETELLGAGVVRYVGRNWDDNVSPGISVAISVTDQLQGAFDPSNPELLSDAGFRVAGIGVLALVLLVYLIIVGPLLFGILNKRKNLTVAWLVIPALAALFSVGLFAGSRISNSGRQDAHAAIVEVNPVSALRSEAFLVSRSGDRGVELPEGYEVVSSSLVDGFNFGGQFITNVPTTVRPSRTTTELELQIDSGSGGVAYVRGTDEGLTDTLRLSDLRFDGSMLIGTVENESSERLEGVAVFVGDRDTHLNTIEAGQSATFTIDVAAREGRFGSELRDWNIEFRNEFFGGGGPEPSEELEDGPVNGSRWVLWRASKQGAAVPDGLVTAVGWSREFDGTRDNEGRTALIARAALPQSDGPVLPGQLREFRMSVPSVNRFGDFGGDDFTEVIQLVHPVGGDVSELALTFPQDVQEVDLWVDGEWRQIAADNDTGPSVDIPTEAWEGNVLTARYTASNFVDPTRRFAGVVSRTDGTDDVGLLPPGESAERDVNDQFEDERFFGPEGPAVLGSQVEIVHSLTDATVTSESQGFSSVEEGFIEGTYDEWTIELGAGDRLEVEMLRLDNRDDLDPYLIILGPDGRQVASDDDGAGNLNSRIDMTIEETGMYTIEARPLSDFGFGGYELLIDIDRPGQG